jgi:hypothetical protein
MLRPTARTALLPAARLLSALTACAAGSPTGPSAPTLRHDGTTTQSPPTDSVKAKPANYENPTV